MVKILGLDLGTNSIGWAITEQNENQYKLIDRGVCIFQEGVNRTKSGEEPMVKVRTDSRALRRHYYRRRLRKIELLKVLIKHNLCPYLSQEMLDNWRYKKLYPKDNAFMEWLRTNDKDNPYSDRFHALTEILDLNIESQRYVLGRALYHIAQRRGFLSNRKDKSSSDDGVVKGAIKTLDNDMNNANCKYLGEFYYKLYLEGKKIRTGDGYGYAGRISHYEKEFNAICEKQQLSEELKTSLHKAIFFQRPLKSQKGLVGTCTFEKNKARCPISHPRFEEYRMLSFINNIKIKTPTDPNLRPLSQSEIQLITPLFFRKSKEHFDFEDIAKKLSGGKKGNYGYIGDKAEFAYKFNFKMSQTVSGCPTTTALKGIFGEDYISSICELYVKSEGKNSENILNDIWHILFSYDNDDKIATWAKENLQLNEEQAIEFINIPIKQGYAALSLKAINKISPWLRAGYRYDEAVFIANLPSVVTEDIWSDNEMRNAIINDVCSTIEDYSNNIKQYTTKKKAIEEILLINYGIDYNTSSRLYEPSRLDTYAKSQPNANGLILLGSPRTSSVRNPMAMRALFRLRALINRLLHENKIDKSTKINIEFARELNDKNMRIAIEHYQRENANQHKEYAEEIHELYTEETGKDIEVTADDILKYQLWKEQNKVCLYTGEQIRISDFIGANPKYDIEHTVPRSRGGDNSQMNKTLCQYNFNRDIKKNKLPSELSNHSEIMARIEQLGWEKEILKIEKQIDGCIRSAKNAVTKDAKDKAISDKHYLRMKCDYWKGKLQRFTMDNVPSGFNNRQSVDIGIIGKYAKMYLESVFDKVYTIKGATTADFRKMWGLQDEYTKKDRINHVHHCIDAITIACIGSGAYKKWAQYQQAKEEYDWFHINKPTIEKPWSSFTEDVKNVVNDLLISHHTSNNLPKHARKKLRIRGKIQYNAEGKPIYMQGDTARGSLHQQSFYGAIKRDDEVKYVIRKSLSSLQPTDVDKIVDEAVKECIKSAINREGFKEAVSKPILFNDVKGVYIKKVRIYASTVTNPIHLKKHRDESRFEYKKHYHVVNDSNYCMAIYEGTDRKGKTKRTFKIVNNLDAVKFYNSKTNQDDLVTLSDDNDYPLKCILHTGTMVLFYEHSVKELYNCSQTELVKRLYKVIKMSKDGRITFKYHQEARNDELLKECYHKEHGQNAPKMLTNGYSDINFESPHPKLLLSPSKFNMYVEGYDFELTITGEIKFKH